MAEFENVFPESVPEILPPQLKISHHIAIKDEQAIKTLPTYTVPEQYMSLLKDWLDQKEQEGVIYRTETPGAAPLFVQPKTDRRIRLLVDLMAWNSNTVKDDVQIPNQKQILNAIGRAKYRSKIDLSDAYFQTRVRKEDEKYNTFKTPFGEIGRA